MMKVFLVVTLTTFFWGYSVHAQNSLIKYDFGDKEASFNPNPGASSISFLPKVTENKAIKARVRTASDGSGAFNLVKKGADFIKESALEIVAGTTTSKFSLYNLNTGAVNKTSFNFKIDKAGTGQWVFANGVSANSDDIFQGNSGVKETSTEIFVGLRLNVSEANELNFYTRNGNKWSMVKGVGLLKGTDYLIEIYSNNSTEEKKYSKESEQILPVGTYHVWINGKRIAEQFVTGGLTAGNSLSGFLVYGVTPKGNDTMSKAWLDNLEINSNL
ncbi:hypothetical protein [Pseudopedobacter beijingensis]|uniref:Uncharacterized protein n=1 Tax=Pseudopedobacter beijingensis TaxID=1207056 RepID=A0ABW4II98_9SPHI